MTPENNMKIIKNLKDYNSDLPAVVTIGKFDGIHRGHQALIRRAALRAEELREKGKPVSALMFAFDMTPVMLLTKKERRNMVAALGIDTILEYTFDPAMITMSAEDFCTDILSGKLNARHVVVGEDFRFGYKRQGDADFLKEMGTKCGFTVEAVPDIMDGEKKISSSAIRKLLLNGEMEKVNDLLGYTYSITGRIIRGKQLGRTIGIPTANIKPGRHKLLPPDGVYTSDTVIDGIVRHGITDIGSKPTVDGQFTGVETYFFDFDGDVYGEKLTVQLLHHTRPEIRFDSVEELKEQLERDKLEGRSYFRNRSETSS
jgi:riboflavin kinase/FMN adenylyltransferase